jgi:hypothetical protein
MCLVYVDIVCVSFDATPGAAQDNDDVVHTRGCLWKFYEARADMTSAPVGTMCLWCSDCHRSDFQAYSHQELEEAFLVLAAFIHGNV